MNSGERSKEREKRTRAMKRAAVGGDVDGLLRRSKGAGTKCDLRKDWQREKEEESRKRRDKNEATREKKQEKKQSGATAMA